MEGDLLKIGIDKAYDKVKWLFLQQTLRMKGFAQKWCELIAQFAEIRVNNDSGHYLQTRS
jgi:hypothetical protein